MSIFITILIINLTLTSTENPDAYQLVTMTVLLQAQLIDGYRGAIVTVIAPRNILISPCNVT